MTRIDLEGVGMTSRRTRNRLVARLRKAGIADERVLDAIASVPRHIFVDEALAHRAYEDSALPIGHGQTISQPYVVAAMTAAVMGRRLGERWAPPCPRDRHGLRLPDSHSRDLGGKGFHHGTHRQPVGTC